MAGFSAPYTNWLKLLAIDCKEFKQIAAYKSMGPQNTDNFQAVLWIGPNAYVAFRDSP